MNEISFTLGGLVGHAWQTVQRPQDGLRVLQELHLPREALWLSLALVVVISVILQQLTLLIVGSDGLLMAELQARPVMTGVVQGSLFVLMVFAIFWIGRALGGVGSFEDTILAVTWLQFIMVCLQVLQTVLMLVLPPFASLVGILGLVLFFYLLTHFIATIHGFESLGRVFFMIILSLFGIIFGLSVLLTMIGVTVPGTT